jgi:hypothetical protein
LGCGEALLGGDDVDAADIQDRLDIVDGVPDCAAADAEQLSEGTPRHRAYFLAGRREAVATLWQRAVDRGDASPDTDVDDVIDILFGPLIFRRLTGHYDLTDEHAEKLARTALDGLMRSTV